MQQELPGSADITPVDLNEHSNTRPLHKPGSVTPIEVCAMHLMEHDEL